MARLLNKTDISDLCLGTTVLGTGGRGSPELGFLILSRLLEMGTEIRLISVKEVPDDEIVVHPAMIGSIAPSKIDKNLLLCGLSMREGDLYVKRILPHDFRFDFRFAY